MYGLWVKDIKEAADKYCRVGRGYSEHLVMHYRRFKRIIDAAINDGLDHIVPALLYFGLTPNECKTVLGKSLWKKLCRFTRTRNHLIFLKAYKFIDGLNVRNVKGYTVTRRLKVQERELLSLLIDLPTTYLHKHSLSTYLPVDKVESLTSLLWVKKSCELKLSDIYRVDLSRTMYLDTKRMAESLGHSFNPNWSEIRMRRMHDHFNDLILMRNFPKDKFHVLSKFEKVSYLKKLNSIPVEASLLNSPYKLYEEGCFMGHCVSSYCEQVQNGKSVIFSLKEIDSNTRSTLELVLHKGKYVPVQHEGRYGLLPSNILNEYAMVLTDAVNNSLGLSESHGRSYE